MRQIGDNSSICFKIAEDFDGGLLDVSIFADSTNVTPVDSATYIPSFIESLRREKEETIEKQRDRTIGFFCHGPTTDDVSAMISFRNEKAHLIFQTQEKKANLDVSTEDLLNLYSQVIQYLKEKLAYQVGAHNVRKRTP